MARDLSNCSPSVVLASDTPSGFENNHTQLCGLSYPSSSPLSDLEECCDGPVQVYNGCLQYCLVHSKSPLSFQECAAANVMHEDALASRCNFAEAKDSKQEIGRTKNAGNAVTARSRSRTVKWQMVMLVLGAIGAQCMIP